MTELLFKKLNNDAVLPTRGSDGAAALDLYTVESATIPAHDYVTLPTGVAVAIPEGYYGRVAPRSGLSAKHGIDVLAGVVDSDYRGEVMCVLANVSNEPFTINKGDRIAQLVIEAIITPQPAWAEDLPQTVRADKGLGSSGY